MYDCVSGIKKYEAQCHEITAKIVSNLSSSSGVIEPLKKALALYEELAMVPEQINTLIEMGR